MGSGEFSGMVTLSIAACDGTVAPNGNSIQLERITNETYASNPEISEELVRVSTSLNMKPVFLRMLEGVRYAFSNVKGRFRVVDSSNVEHYMMPEVDSEYIEGLLKKSRLDGNNTPGALFEGERYENVGKSASAPLVDTKAEAEKLKKKQEAVKKRREDDRFLWQDIE